MSLRTTILTSAFATAITVVSCGGSDHKKGQPVPEDAGAAGESAPPEEVAGGAGAGAGGEGGSEAPVSSAGEGGSEPLETAGAGGEGGAPPIEPELLKVLFTVGTGAKGLTGSALSEVEHPTSVIFGSSSPTPEAVNGTNRVAITAAQLGIDDADTLDAFTALRPLPQTPLYLFSITGHDNEQGERPTRLNRSSVEDGVPGDVYASEAIISYRSLGEGGDQLGDNELIADEQSLGLASAPIQQGERDDLTGVLPLLDGALPTELYFSVSRDSVGLKNTAVAASDATERGCTIFKSSLDGKNSVAFSCTQLGLAANDDVKGISVLSSADSQKVLFTVDNASHGVVESGVDFESYKANNVFSSLADGTNELEVPGKSFGLYHYDEIDALAVVDQQPADYGVSSNCTLTPSPLDSTGAGLSGFNSAHGLGKTLLLVTGPAGPTDSVISRVAAYNVKTCAFVAGADLSQDALHDHGWVPVPLAGWSASDPLKKLEYWQFGSQGEEQDLRLRRLDATGQVVNSYAFDTIPDPDQTGYLGYSIELDAANDRLVGVLSPKFGNRAYRRIVFARPGADVPDDTLLKVDSVPLPHPCAFAPTFGAVGDDGTSYFAQWDSYTYSTFRVCPLSDSGEFVDLPFSVSISSSRPNWGMLVPNDSAYGLYDFNNFALVRQSLK